MGNLNTTIFWAKVKPEARIPEKDRENAGYDIYSCFDEDVLLIEPFETKMVPTGIASHCSFDYCFILKERGSTGSKGIGQRCGVIDSGYTGEWFVPITNINPKPLAIVKQNAFCPDLENHFIVHPYEKAICQALLIPVPSVITKVVDYYQLLEFESKRGIGCLGSSGN